MRSAQGLHELLAESQPVAVPLFGTHVCGGRGTPAGVRAGPGIQLAGLVQGLAGCIGPSCGHSDSCPALTAAATAGSWWRRQRWSPHRPLRAQIYTFPRSPRVVLQAGGRAGEACE